MAEQDKRRATRKRVFKGGTIVFNERSSTLSCTVKDISDTGARLRIPKGQSVPAQFSLIIEVDGLEAPCTVTWRKGDEIGIVFDAPPSVGTPKRAQVVTALDSSGPSLRRKPPK